MIFNSIDQNNKNYSSFIICPIFAILGCYIGCELASYYGRRLAFIFNNLFYISGNLLVSAMQSLSFVFLNKDPKNDFSWYILLTVLIIGRVLCGIGVGFSSFLVPLYSNMYSVRELAPIEIYARLGSINQFMITLGILVSYVIGYFCSHGYLLIFTFTFPVLVSLLQIGIFCKIYINDTPTFLMANNKRTEAMLLISRLYFGFEASEESFDVPDASFVPESLPATYMDLFKSWRTNSNFRVGCILAGLQQLSGINYFIVTSSSILPIQDARLYTVILGIVNCVSSVFTVFILKKTYKRVLMYGALGMTSCYIVALSLIFTEKQIFSYGYLFISFAFIVFFEISIGPILWIYCADILCIRGVAIISSINWICASIIIGVFGVLGVEGNVKYHSDCDDPYCISFIFYTFLTMIFCLLVKII